MKSMDKYKNQRHTEHPDAEVALKKSWQPNKRNKCSLSMYSLVKHMKTSSCFMCFGQPYIQIQLPEFFWISMKTVDLSVIS